MKNPDPQKNVRFKVQNKDLNSQLIMIETNLNAIDKSNVQMQTDIGTVGKKVEAVEVKEHQ